MKRGPSEQRIVRRVRAADRLFQQQRGMSWLLRGAVGLVVALVALFAADVILHLGNGARLALVLALAGAGAAFLLGCAVLAFVKTNPLERTARLLEDRDPSLGSKIINLLQLREKADDEGLPPMTRDLAGRAIEEAAAGLAGADFPALTRERARRRRELWTAALPAALFAVACLVFPGLSKTEWARFLDPLGDHPPYSLTKLEIVDPTSGTEVDFKGSVVVKVEAAGHMPDEVFLSAYPPDAPGEVTTVPTFGRGDLGFVQDLENITSDIVVYAHTADGRSVSQKRTIHVVLTPKVESAEVTVAPPAYTGRAPSREPYTFKNVRALAGSEVVFRIRSNRPLRDGTLQLSGAGGGTRDVVLAPDPEAPDEVVGRFLADQSARATFGLRDVTGIPNDGELRGSLTVTEDLPPKISIVQPRADTFVVHGFKTDVIIEASDDYGLARIRVHRALNGLYSAPISLEHDEITRRERLVLPLDLATLGVAPGDVLSFGAEAIDTRPDPQLARSKTIHLAVISENEYNDFMRARRDAKDMENKYAALLDELHSLVDEQQELADAFDALEQNLAANPPETPEAEAAAAEAMAELEKRQHELNSQLAQTAERFENFVRDNPLYDFEEDIAESLADFAQELRESASQNAEDMENAAGASKDPGGGQAPPSPRQIAAGMGEAARDQLGRLGGTAQQAHEDITEPLEDIADLHELVKGFNQFGDLYELQQGIAEQAKAFSGGRELTADDRRALQQLAETEQAVGAQLDALAQKLEADAAAAAENFPKAAQSAADLAHAIRSNQMSGLANRASSVMVQGRGESSYQNAENLRKEMENLLGDCQQGQGQMSGELDQYFRLTRGGSPGRSFAQMMMSRRFRPDTPSQGGGSAGGGMAGTSGSMMTTSPNMDVLGGESELAAGKGGPRDADKGSGEGDPATTDPATADRSDSITGTEPNSHDSGPIDGTPLIEQYRTLVEEYFRRLTAPNPEP